VHVTSSRASVNVSRLQQTRTPGVLRPKFRDVGESPQSEQGGLAVHSRKVFSRTGMPLTVTIHYVKPVLNWTNVCSPNILRTVRRNMILFLIELLVRRKWVGQFRLYFVRNWLVMRCKLRPELAADAQQTA